MIILTLLESMKLGKPKTLSELTNERGNRLCDVMSYVLIKGCRIGHSGKVSLLVWHY